MRGPSGLSGEISRAGADADRAVAARVGGDRGARPRAGRHRAGGAGHGDFDVDDHPRAQRVAGAGPDDCGARAAAGWRPEADDRQGSHAAARLGGVGRADRLGGPGIPTALDGEEREATGPDTADHGPPRQSPIGGRAVDCRRVQLASEPEDARRVVAPRPGRSVPPHHRAGPALPGGGPAGDLGGHEEEGVGGRFQECRARSGARWASRNPCACTTS